MSSEKKSLSTGIGVGSSSILAIFVVLCLTTFATLSLVSARADYKLTAKVSASVTAYYAADAEAEERLLQLAHCVEKSSAEELPAALAAAGFTTVTKDGSTVVRYDITISNEKKLHVEIEAATLRRLCWQVQATENSQQEKGNAGEKIANLPVLG